MKSSKYLASPDKGKRGLLGAFPNAHGVARIARHRQNKSLLQGRVECEGVLLQCEGA